LVWTSEDLERLLREQVRVAVLARQELEKKPGWISRLWHRLARLWSDRIHFWLWFVTVSFLALAVGLLLTTWPPGGSEGRGSLAVAQGASLIFVVILVGLMMGLSKQGGRLVPVQHGLREMQALG
jgi:hypothetical protein